jgi:hypothetical protein
MFLLTLAQNSEMVNNFIGRSGTHGSPEEWNPTPGTNGPIDFSADVAKRDAVVEAFKVLACYIARLRLVF